jgi:DnaJ-class molecular chaperone
MDYKDYYKILGVDKKATHKEIKAAYRKLARKHHPDVNPGDKKAETTFKEINEAYEVVGDEAKRKKYDELGANWKHYQQWQQAGGEASGQPFDWSQFGFGTGPGRSGGYQTRTVTEDELKDLFGESGPFSSFFYTFFGGAEPGSRTRRNYRTASRPRRGQDLEQPVEIGLEEAFRGTNCILQLQDMEGKVRRLEAKIPPGVQEGSRIRLTGQGGPGMGGGPAGDLYIVVNISPHQLFERKGNDLYLKVQVPLTTAILGGEINVPTLNGRAIMLKIPPETQNGRVFRLRGKGIPKLDTAQQAGDLLAEVKVVLPQSLSEKERKLFEEFSSLRSADDKQ